MRLSEDVLRELVESLKHQRFNRTFQIGRQVPAGTPQPRVQLAPRAKVCPCSDGNRRRAWTVALRSATASGIVFVDGNCWMDGERFILRFPTPSKIPAMLCAITYWQPLESDTFVVSANFVRALRELPEDSREDDVQRRYETER